MGWKNVKLRYNIKHQIEMNDGDLCIGSGYIHNMIMVGVDGIIKKRYDGNNKDLIGYQSAFERNPDELSRLIQSPDIFDQSITVYTYHDGIVIEKQCEKLGWPNVTHDGEKMYENTFSTDRDVVVQWAKRDVDYHLKYLVSEITETSNRLIYLQSELASTIAKKSALKAESNDLSSSM